MGNDNNRVLYMKDLVEDRLKNQPYLRATTLNNISVNNTWVRLDFSGNSNFNNNTFPLKDVDKMIYWDNVNKKFIFNRDTIGFYSIKLDFLLKGGNRNTTLDMRFVIPAPTPIYFPLPESFERKTLIRLLRKNSLESADHLEIIRTTDILTDYGLGVELKITNNASNVKLEDGIIQIYPN